MRQNKLVHGFTLVELIVAVAVLAIMATLSAPMFGELVAANRTRSAAYSLVGSLTLARSEAVKRNGTVSVFPFASGWKDGWEIDSAGTMLRTNELPQGLALSGPAAGVSYRSNGRLSAPGIVKFTVTAATTGYTRCVTIDPGGRASLEPGERNDGSCS